MSNRLFQGVVHQMRDTIGRVIGVIDENSTIVACSELSRIGTNSDFFTIELGDSHDVFIRDGYTYKPFGVHVKPDYAVFIEGTDDQAAKYASILAISLSSIKQYYDEKYDRNTNALCRKKICCKGRLLLQVSGRSVRTAYPDGAFGRALQRAHQLLPFSCAATRASRSRREKTQPQ